MPATYTTGVKIFYIEETNVPETWSFCPHTHECYHMFVMQGNEAIFYIDNKKMLLKESEAIIAAPGVVHAMEAEDTQRPIWGEVLFQVHMPHLVKSILELPCPVYFDETARTLFDHIKQIGNTRQEHMIQYANTFLEALLSHLCMAVEDTHPMSLNKQLIDTAGYSDVTKSVIIFIDENYTRHISLDDIADQLQYSKSYLCTVFKKDCGITINDYLNLVRINRITQYLSYTSQDISYLCRICGFQNTSHFNRTFKQFLGASPSAYKRMQPVFFNDRMFLNGASPELNGKIQSIVQRLGTLPVNLPPSLPPSAATFIGPTPQPRTGDS